MNDTTFIINDTIFCIRDQNYKHSEDCERCSDFDEYVYGIAGDGKKEIIGVCCLKSYTHSHICKSCGNKDYMLVFSDYKKHIHKCNNCGSCEFDKVYEVESGQKEVVSEALKCPDCEFILNEVYRAGKTIQCKCGAKFEAGKMFSFNKREKIDGYMDSVWISKGLFDISDSLLGHSMFMKGEKIFIKSCGYAWKEGEDEKLQIEVKNKRFIEKEFIKHFKRKEK